MQLTEDKRRYFQLGVRFPIYINRDKSRNAFSTCSSSALGIKIKKTFKSREFPYIFQWKNMNHH